MVTTNIRKGGNVGYIGLDYYDEKTNNGRYEYTLDSLIKELVKAGFTVLELVKEFKIYGLDFIDFSLLKNGDLVIIRSESLIEFRTVKDLVFDFEKNELVYLLDNGLWFSKLELITEKETRNFLINKIHKKTNEELIKMLNGFETTH